MNLEAIRTIYVFELARTVRTIMQSVISPVLSTSLYFIVFGAAIGSRIDQVEGDTITFDRLTLNLGVRWGRAAASTKSSTQEGSSIFPQYPQDPRYRNQSYPQYPPAGSGSQGYPSSSNSQPNWPR